MRVGYLSHDFGDHPTGHLFNSVPQLHARGGAVEAVYFSLKVTLLVNLSLSIFLIFFRKLTHVGELWRRCKEASAVGAVYLSLAVTPLFKLYPNMR